jgi:uncharacterized HAD superfamily protein
MPKPTIAIDLDDVLAASAQGLVAFSNERWGTNLTVDDYSEDWGKMWQIDRAAERERAKAVHSSRMFPDLLPHEDALAVLKRLKPSYDLVIATSRVIHVHSETLAWLERHYAGIFSGVHTSGIYDDGASDEAHRITKAELVREIGADYLIDDQLKHCLAVAEAGIETVLFGNYAWNQYDGPLPAGITRCANWVAVEAYFNGRV